MRARRRKIIQSRTRIPGEKTEARERLERRWFDQIVHDSSLTTAVTAKGAREEPFHRWLVFKQAYSPELVRRFLSEAFTSGSRPENHWLLDPFSGTGTFVVECARQGMRALGIEPLPALAYVSSAKTACVPDEFPAVVNEESWREIAPRLKTRAQRVGLICAMAMRQNTRGQLNPHAPNAKEAMERVAAMMQDDWRQPPPRTNPVLVGDGRNLACLRDGSVGGVLTSPPYLSRHDYSRIVRPLAEVYECFCDESLSHFKNRPQVSAHKRSSARHAGRRQTMAAIVETTAALDLAGERKWSDVTGRYFAELGGLLREVYRVLIPGGPCWMVIAGARIKDVYIPSDTILAELANEIGFVVEEIRVARRVISSSRRFGGLNNVAPRESVLCMRKPSSPPARHSQTGGPES